MGDQIGLQFAGLPHMPPAEHDPGGRVRVRWPAGSVVKSAFGGPDRSKCYRYWLTEIWDESHPLVMWLMMNPSIANLAYSDPTLAKTGKFTKRWKRAVGGNGFGGQIIANVHAYRATDKEMLLGVNDPVGPRNDRIIALLARRAEFVVLAYGQPPKPLRERGWRVAAMLLELGIDVRVLRLAKDLTPCHPLYLPEDLLPVRSPEFEAKVREICAEPGEHRSCPQVGNPEEGSSAA